MHTKTSIHISGLILPSNLCLDLSYFFFSLRVIGLNICMFSHLYLSQIWPGRSVGLQIKNGKKKILWYTLALTLHLEQKYGGVQRTR
jgi:hypothetical protein